MSCTFSFAQHGSLVVVERQRKSLSIRNTNATLAVNEDHVPGSMRSAGMSSARPSIMLTAYVPGQHHVNNHVNFMGNFIDWCWRAGNPLLCSLTSAKRARFCSLTREHISGLRRSRHHHSIVISNNRHRIRVQMRYHIRSKLDQVTSMAPGMM